MSLINRSIQAGNGCTTDDRKALQALSLIFWPVLLLLFLALVLRPAPVSAGEGETAAAQESGEAEHSYHPLVLKLNDDGSKYIRFMMWHQFWIEGSRHIDEDDAIDFGFTLRRSRILMMAQVSPRFLILTHFGANSITTGNMEPTGSDFAPSFFIHDAWMEFAIYKNYISAGAGLHYWNGISRLTNQGTISMLTIDMPRFNWPSIGTTDQYARHLGLYLKGKAGRFDYRVSFNQPIRNTLDKKAGMEPGFNQAVYRNDGHFLYAGYFMYQFLDRESNKVPYLSGTYLGKKRVLNLGAGFNVHPQGSQYLSDEDTLQYNVRLFGADLFTDLPLGKRKEHAFTGYAVYYRYDFGPNYKLGGESDIVATGNIYYAQAGYLLPEFTDKGRLQFYVAGSVRDLEAYSRLGNTITTGATWFILGHSAKISFEYHNDQYAGGGPRKGFVRMQAAIML
jgi:hypothetical protein